MIRHAIKRSIFRTEYTEAEVEWVSIGTGYTTDVQYAHLYTHSELAERNLLSRKKSDKIWLKHIGATATYEIINFEVTELAK